MRGTVRRAIAALAACAAVLTVLVASVPAATAASTVPFAAKFATNANGSILSIGNNLLTCPTGASGCAAARAGASADNNGFAMVPLDADTDPSTRNSSMSRLDLPAGATVLWAGLYWGARLQAGTQGTAGNAANITRMSLRVPGSATYQTVTASTAAHDQFGPNGSSYNAYQRFADVTALVQQAGNGEYWGGNVEAATGADRYAGWAMTVVYTAPGLPLRNLTVFDGFDVVSQGNPQSITVSGFQAPLAGTVDAQLTMVAYEGDLSQTGDFTRLENTQLATALSPGSNFFDSANGLNGASVTTRAPADRNQLGFDIKNLGASGAIANGATSARFTFSSNGDVYYPGVVGLAINLYAPDFTASSKTVVDVTGNSPARPGDTLQYTLNYANTGQDPAVGVVSQDALPPGTTYVPGSLALLDVLTGAATPLSDAAGDDVGEYSAADRAVRVRLGSGATASTGGRMACSGSGCTDDGTSRTAYTFQVTLDDAAGGTTVTNLADLGYRTGTTGIAATYTTNPATTDVITRADVRITKEMSPDPAPVGGDAASTVTVTNDGPNAALGTVVRDPAVAGTVVDAVEAPPGVTCTLEIVCTLGTLPAGASVVLTIHGHTPPSSTLTNFTNVASVSTTSYDPDLTNNTAADTVTLQQVADLGITKTASPTSAAPGSAVRYTLAVHNDGASDAQGVVLSDLFDDPTLLAATTVVGTTGGATCAAPSGGAVRCTVATLAAGADATVTLRAVLAPALPGGTVVGNAATVTAGTADPDSSDNRATAQVTTTAPSADVRLTKVGPVGVVAGEPVSWLVTATNFGPSDATGAVVTDTAPPGVTITGATTTRGTCTTTPSTVTCTLDTLRAALLGRPGPDTLVTVFGVLDPDAAAGAGALTNTAAVTATTADPVPANNTASATSDVVQAYDLAVTKRANRASLPAAAPNDTRPVDYTITVTNRGPSVASGVTLTDLVPTALTFVSATPDAGTCTAPTATADPAHDQLTCALTGTIPVGGTRTVAVSMVADTDLAAVGEPVTETVTVAAPADTDPSDDSATWTLSGEPYSDLSLAKTAPGTVTAGTTMTYTFGITNHPIPPDSVVALAPTVQDTLPPGVTLVPAGTAGSVTPPWCTASGQDVTCATPPVTGNIAPGATSTFAITVQVAPDVAAGTTLTNTATVVNDPSNPDPAPANNTAQATTSVTTDADVLVTGLSVAPRDPAATGAGTWRDVTFTLRNDGPSVARTVTFRVAVEADAVVDLSTLPAGCALTSGELVCTVDGADLAPGQQTTIGFGIALAGYVTAGDYALSAHVASATPDSNPANNDAATTFPVTAPRTALQVTKVPVDAVANPADGHPSFVAGTTYAYRITVAVPNAVGNGVADAQDVTLTDVVPPGLAVTLVSTTQGTCDVTGGGTGIACSLGRLAAWPGSATPVVVTVYGVLDVSDEGEQIVNTATAASPTLDQDGVPASVSAATAVDIVEQADLLLIKTADASVVGPDGVPVFAAGGAAGYTLTTVNAGPSDVEHAQVVDTLPPGLTLDPAASPTCSVTGGTPATGQVVTCVVGAVGVGASVAVRLVATTSPDDGAPTAGDPRGRPVTNTGVVSSQATDPVPENDTASASARIERLADAAISSAVSTTTPAAGGDLTITGSTINNGPSSAWDTTGDTTFPPGFVPVSADVPFNTCTWNRTPPADPTAVPWEDFSYVLHCEPADPSSPWTPGVASTSVVVMHIPGDTPQGSYSGVSSIATTTPEVTLANNSTAQTVYVQHVSDTHVEKTLVSPNPLQAGRPATWRLTVTNDGPSVAEDVVLSDDVPDGMSYVAASIEGGPSCPPPETYDTEVGDTATILRCPLGTLAPGESVSTLVTFGVDADRTGQDLCNAALVGSGSLDPDAPDNESDACGPVVAPPAADVALAVTPDTATTRSGARVSLLATVSNAGPGQATGVVATFDIPAGLTDYAGVAVEWPDGRTQPADCVVGSLTCTVGDLAPGEQVVYRIVGTATGSPGAALLVTGATTHGEPDPVTANDTDTATLTLVGAPIGETPTPVPSPDVPPAAGGASVSSGSSALSSTGADVVGVLVAALVALGAGGGLLLTRRRARS